VTAHAPAAPRTQPRLRAEHVVAAVVLVLGIVGFSAVVPDGLPRGEAVATSCTWHGSRLVVSGALANTGMSDAQFRIDTRIRIDGRRHAVHRVAFADLSALSTDRWTAPPYRYTRKGLVGNAIVGCAAHVRMIPPPSGED
jgi:hypothetical protein